MSCTASIFSKYKKRLPRPAAGVDALAGDERRRVEVMGTWDFKWPIGTNIRVAFQPSSSVDPDDFAKAQALVREIAERWLSDAANIGIEWVDLSNVLDHAEDQANARADGPNNRSSFVIPSKPEDYRDYDVLVSLDPLSTLRRPLLFPKSEVGSFARRVDYGEPTMFIGPHRPAADSLAAYYRDDPLAQFYVCHEFGHALGLPHEHQNPNFRRADKELDQRMGDPKALSSAIRDAWERLHRIASEDIERDVPNVERFVRNEISEIWPGNPAFSDFRNYDAYNRQSALGSVMMMPFFGRFVGVHDCGKAGCTGCETEPLNPAPSADDLKQLAAMYPRANAGNRKEPLTFVLQAKPEDRNEAHISVATV